MATSKQPPKSKHSTKAGTKTASASIAASAKARRTTAAGVRSKDQAASGSVSPSKRETALSMLRQPKGTTVAAVVEATGWQQHSVRGFFAAVIKKKLKLKLTSEKVGKERVYRIAKPGVS